MPALSRRRVALTACAAAFALGATSPALAVGSTSGAAPGARAGHLHDAGRIVFSTPIDGGGASVATISADGTGRASVEVATDLEDFNKSTWSHDGRHLLHSNTFVLDLPGIDLAFRPAITAADGSGLRVLRLPRLSGDMYCSAWSPDDARIVCAVDGDLFSLRVSDGRGVRRLSANPYDGNDLAVGYSPDGRRLAFLRARPGPGGDDELEREALFVARADGSHARRVSGWDLLPHELAGANWAPDGRSLLSIDRWLRIVEVAADGSWTRRVRLDLDGEYSAVTPDVSPDGSRIVVAVFRDGLPSDLYVARRDGSHAHPVDTTPDVSEWLPDWSAVARHG